MRTRIIWTFVLVGMILLAAATFAILNETHRLLDPMLTRIAELLEMFDPDLESTSPAPTASPTPSSMPIQR